MTIRYQDDRVRVYEGDCTTIMPTLPASSVDSLVCDPPYELTASRPGREGSPSARSRPGREGGFLGKEWDATGVAFDPATWAHALRLLRPGGHLVAFGGTRTWHRMAVAVEDAGFQIRDSIAWIHGAGFPKSRDLLKPAFEPILVARKPLRGTLSANRLEHGTGGLNINACRIPSAPAPSPGRVGEPSAARRYPGRGAVTFAATPGQRGGSPLGRWPANVVVDQDEADLLDQQSGQLVSGANPTLRSADKFRSTYGTFTGQTACTPARGKDCGGASRFLTVVHWTEGDWTEAEQAAPPLAARMHYCAKAGSAERPEHDGVQHPTVKPLELIRWLVRLVTPPGGMVLDGFAGSGSVGEAALLEGLRCTLIEREPQYIPLIAQRIQRRRDPLAYLAGRGEDLGLFDRPA